METSEFDSLLQQAKAARRDEPKSIRYEAVRGSGGGMLRYAVLPARPDGGDVPATPHGTVVFLPGRTEFIEKYIEDMRVVRGLGYAAAAMDLRGQGLSVRPGEDRGRHWIDNFNHHVRDVRALIRRLEAEGLPRPYIALAHSAGGHVVLRVLHDEPGLIDKAVLSAPMVGIATGGLPAGFAKGLANFMHLLGLDHLYVPGHSAFREGAWGWRKQLTHDGERFRDEDHFIAEKEPALAVGGATFGWVRAALRSCDRLNAPGFAEAIDVPVMILRAGQDTIVDLGAMDRFAARLPKGMVVPLEGAKHEILKETDDVRRQAWAAIREFLGC
ncbi:alpha/beta fold hydrolase [Eilatimonas milleporae]|uniref:Lysophospholipase n=1 Tax=Eilatimonas milleporae TaxID=911205 RepID=A0A3M0CXU8_9PROT|nr:alpha/beta hydrolase [Eilatimonas milleporae]RMB12489.1 lysophospholipase [Eilatimonas milleporae]